MTYGGSLNALAIDKNAVAAIEVAQPPLAVLEDHLGMCAAHIFIFDADFAIFDAPDSKRFQEMEILAVCGRRPNGYTQQGRGWGRSFDAGAHRSRLPACRLAGGRREDQGELARHGTTELRRHGQ
ncbi:MAG: hypothetical protein ABSH24_31540 [Bryobacteraceae bacterium]